MSGIVFFRNAARERLVEFYRSRLGFDPWVEQDGCTILVHDDLKLGFCDTDGDPDTDGIVTLYYDSREDVDEKRAALADVAVDDPRVNDEYDIYQFLGEDPEGRSLEFQAFLHDLPE